MKVWLDDIRPNPPEYDVWVKTADEAIVLLKKGKVSEISLDHDLGEGNGVDKTGYDVALFIEEGAALRWLQPITCYCHSANPVGKTKIEMALKRAHEYWMEAIAFHNFK